MRSSDHPSHRLHSTTTAARDLRVEGFQHRKITGLEKLQKDLLSCERLERGILLSAQMGKQQNITP